MKVIIHHISHLGADKTTCGIDTIKIAARLPFQRVATSYSIVNCDACIEAEIRENHTQHKKAYFAGVNDSKKDVIRMVRKFLDELEAGTETED